ncbi:hypothetical protein FP74_gp001 [Bacillus phage CAM003]|uniref:Uncharacterized protein n=2 Tax=Bastillevirus TaxID=1918010 RepID=A0A024B2U1_9CAUD|nr:hypothetical protein FP73_gp001 [Bacillus phage Hoody T]YP_009036904.1 hypothetical protein FP74_gp001 [Bacillus phage CAM003]AHZ09438.1 hypothetical protein [Bacillus phage CAM003]AHZ10313.1 hypothetical protein [Bacillus phage Hoody T]
MTNVYELNQEVNVEIFRGAEFTGKIVDINSYNSIYWVERAEDKEWFMVDPEDDKIELVQTELPLLERGEDYIRANSHLLPATDIMSTIKEVKAKIKDELSDEFVMCRDIDYVEITIFNHGEGWIKHPTNYGEYIEDLEGWDVEVNLHMEDDSRISFVIGEFFNEADALKHAKAMRSKMNRSSFDIELPVRVYSC